MPALSLPCPTGVRAIHYDPDFPLMYGGSGAWQVYCHASVKQVLQDYHAYSNAYMPQSADYMIGSNLNQTDPPLHPKLRGLIAAPFTKTAIASKEPQIRELCQKFLAPLPADEKMDFMAAFALPLSAAVIGSILGLPEAHFPQVNQWATDLVSAGYSEGGPEKAALAQQQMGALFYSLLEERRQAPREDLLSLLAAAAPEGVGAPPAMPVKIATAMTVLLAGHETTAAWLGNALYIILTEPGLWQTLQSDPGLVPTALAEALRLRPSLVSMYRKTKEDTMLEGVQIKKGDLVNAWISAANRDPEVFEDPDRFSLQRENADKSFSFGYGLHHCIGDTLARTGARIAFEVLLSGLDNPRLAGEPIPGKSLIVSGFHSFPISFRLKPVP